MRFKMQVEYDGTDFAGWQLQNDVKTIQGELEKAFEKILHKQVRIHGAGRTDAGVHARGQVAHFDTDDELLDIAKLHNGINGLTPKSISVKKMEMVDNEFHARYSAKSRTYRYYISRTPRSINARYMWQYFSELDNDKMHRFCAELTGYKDYQSFCKSLANVEHYLCDVNNAKWYEDEYGIWIFEINANRFLHGMVRSLVGTLIKIGIGKINFDDLKKIFDARNREAAPMAAPAMGLILENVEY